jgi:hypothetical protein
MRALNHLIAIGLGALAVFWLRPQERDIQPIVGPVDQRLFLEYTPYFPGISALQTHEIFAPRYANKKKIVFLGASTVDSIGCDYTWSRPPADVPPNVHYTCSIAGHMNKLLHERGLGDWHAFNLARNGAKLTSMLYVYARIRELKPEIVVLGEAYNYYLQENAGAADHDAKQYATLEATFGRDPTAAPIWHSYLDTLRSHGATIGPLPAPEPPISTTPEPRTSTTAMQLMVLALGRIRTAKLVDAMARPVDHTQYRTWGPRGSSPTFTNHDPAFQYFQGFTLIDILQREDGHRLFVYFAPQWERQLDKTYVAGIRDVYGAYLREHGVAFTSYVDMPMRPILDTYDGYHLTTDANGKVAGRILQDLQTNGMLKGEGG